MKWIDLQIVCKNTLLTVFNRKNKLINKKAPIIYCKAKNQKFEFYIYVPIFTLK